MSPQQGPGSSATDQIREQLRRGAYGPGAPLPIADLANRMGLSQTPIREALARLAGEGLVLERRGSGYFVEALDAEGLVELYDLHQVLVVTAVGAPRRRATMGRRRAGGAGAVDPEVDGESALVATEALFRRLVSGGGGLLMREHRRLSDRLAPSRAIESEFVGPPGGELAEMARLFLSGDNRALIETVSRYHLRRRQVAPDIVAAMRSSSAP